MSSIKVGNTFETNNYGQVKVVHVGRKDITVRFKDGTDVITESSHLYSGSIKIQMLPLLNGWVKNSKQTIMALL